MALQKRRRGPARTAQQRSAWMKKSGENRPTVQACPNCGAPVDQVNMAGECGHCGAKITRGDFDWVLSKIEQDDSYTG